MTPGSYNIGTGAETSVNQLYEVLGQVSGRDLPPEYGPASPSEQVRSSIDPSKGKVLDWRPETELAVGLSTLPLFRCALRCCFQGFLLFKSLPPFEVHQPHHTPDRVRRPALCMLRPQRKQASALDLYQRCPLSMRRRLVSDALWEGLPVALCDSYPKVAWCKT